MAKKTKTPGGEKVERTLPFKLSDDQKARKGEVAGKLLKQLEAAEETKKAENAKHAARIKDLKKKISVELKAIAEGIERKPVTCTRVKDYEKDEIQFWFEGEVIEAVRMTPADRQQDLSEAKKSEKVNGTRKQPKWQKLAPKFDARSKQSAEDERSEQIATVHKLETSRAGASSMVDPKQ